MFLRLGVCFTGASQSLVDAMPAAPARPRPAAAAPAPFRKPRRVHVVSPAVAASASRALRFTRFGSTSLAIPPPHTLVWKGQFAKRADGAGTGDRRRARRYALRATVPEPRSAACAGRRAPRAAFGAFAQRAERFLSHVRRTMRTVRDVEIVWIVSHAEPRGPEPTLHFSMHSLRRVPVCLEA